MTPDDIKSALSPRINPAFLAEVKAAGIPDENIFTVEFYSAVNLLWEKLSIRDPINPTSLHFAQQGYQGDKAPTDLNLGPSLPHYLAWSGNQVQLKELVGRHLDGKTSEVQELEPLKKPDYYGRTAAHYAAWSGSPAILEWVLTQDKDALKRTDERGRTAAHYAAWSGNPAMLELVLKKDKYTFSRQDECFSTVIHYAALSGSPAILEWVLTQDKDALKRTDKRGLSAAHWAAWSGNPDILELVLREDKEALKRTDQYGSPAAHYAAWSGHPAILEWVLKKDQEALKRTDNCRRTAAHYAAWSGNPAILEWVLTQDKEALNRKNTDGFTVAHYAARSGNPAQLSKILRLTSAVHFSGDVLTGLLNTSIIRGHEINKIFTTLRETLKTNFSLVTVSYPYGIDSGIKNDIDSMLERNQLLMAGLNTIKPPSRISFLGRRDPGSQIAFDKASELKKQVFLLETEAERTQFLKDVQELSIPYWSTRFGLDRETLDVLSVVLKTFCGKLPQKVRGQMNQEIICLMKASAQLDLSWEGALNLIKQEIPKASKELTLLLDYLKYRQIVGIPPATDKSISNTITGGGING